MSDAPPPPPPPQPPAPGSQPIPPAPPQPGYATDPAGFPTSEERTMGLLIHLLPLVAGFVGPLVIWLIKKDESRFIDYHGKESINFQITLFIMSMALVFGGMILAFATMGIGMIVVIPLAIGYGIFAIVAEIMAAMKANRGEYSRYPLCIRFIK